MKRCSRGFDLGCPFKVALARVPAASGWMMSLDLKGPQVSGLSGPDGDGHRTVLRRLELQSCRRKQAEPSDLNGVERFYNFP